MTEKETIPTEKSKKQIAKSPRRSRENHHVIHTDEGWVVVGKDSKKEVSYKKTQKEAISMAREIALLNHSEVIVHARDGAIIGRERYVDETWELDSVFDEVESLQKYIDFKFYGTRPHIRGRKLLVSMVAANEQADQLRISELAADFSLTIEEVLAAILYYREHKSELDQQDIEEQKLFDEMYERYGKKKA